jgi:hypothetical protein
MEDYIRKSNIDEVTADLMVKYDKDGDGSFSKHEVVTIILDLREAIKSNKVLGTSNKLFKSLFMAVVVFCMLLLTSMLGISYAVAVLTANTQVQSDGALFAKGTTTKIATATSGKLYGIKKSEAGYCLSATEAFTIRDSILAGRQVLVETSDEESNTHLVEQLIASGAVIDDEAEKYCFYTPGSTTPTCLARSVECTQARRRLWKVEAARRLREFPGRRLLFCDLYENIYMNDCLEQFCLANVDENGDSEYSECRQYELVSEVVQ